jgi:hypothetical protein
MNRLINVVRDRGCHLFQHNPIDTREIGLGLLQSPDALINSVRSRVIAGTASGCLDSLTN